MDHQIQKSHLQTPHMSFNILHIASYLPGKKINLPLHPTNEEKRLFHRFGAIEQRFWAEKESCSEMGAHAIKEALQLTKTEYRSLDLLINGSATYDFPVPHKSCLTQEQIDNKALVPSIDIGSTCLGFIASCIVADSLLQTGYQKIAIVNSEKCSPSLNPKHFETYWLFGDAATATLLSNEGDGKMLSSLLINYPLAARHTIVEGGGNEHHSLHCEDKDKFYFKMSGIPLLKEAKKLLPEFTQRLLNKAGLTWGDIDLIVPHQASKTALELFAQMFNIPKHKMVINIDEVGNTLSASVPLALKNAMDNNAIQKGMKVMVIGTGAGLSIGGFILQF